MQRVSCTPLIQKNTHRQQPDLCRDPAWGPATSLETTQRALHSSVDSLAAKFRRAYGYGANQAEKGKESTSAVECGQRDPRELLSRVQNLLYPACHTHGSEATQT